MQGLSCPQYADVYGLDLSNGLKGLHKGQPGYCDEDLIRASPSCDA